MRFLSTCTAALLLPVLLTAQGADQQQSAKAVHEQLTAELNKQNREYRAARAAVTKSDAYKAARAARDRAKTSELLSGLKQPDLKALGQKAMAAAANYTGDDRVLLLSWAAINTRDKDVISKVVDEVSAKHIDSPAIVGLLEKAMVLSRPLGAEKAGAFLEKVIADSSNQHAKAWAMYWTSVQMTRGRNVGDDAKAKGAELLAKAEQLAKGTDLGDRIAGPRFVEERLQIGMEVPDIIGEDVDGVPFKLSDYRGKVVVIDFWGFW